MPKSVQIKESLSEKKSRALGSQLQSLPTAEKFKQKAQTDLWEVFAGQSPADDEEVDYENLSDSSKNLIGTLPDNREEKIPWWLEAFKWTATSIGEDEIALNTVDRLSRFQDFVVEETVLRRPELLHERMGKSNEIARALEDFKTIQDELEDHIDLDEGTDLHLPPSIFDMEERRIRTTPEFRTWFNTLVNLCPPLNETLTSLLLLNTGADEDIAREILPPDSISPLEHVDMFNNGAIYNENYLQPLERLIDYRWQVFDLHIPYVNNAYDYLTPLEAALFESWAETNSAFIRENKEWFLIDGSNRPKTIESESRFAQVALGSPLTRKKGRATYVTLSLRSNGRYSTANREQGKRREIDQILESHAGIEADE